SELEHQCRTSRESGRVAGRRGSLSSKHIGESTAVDCLARGMVLHRAIQAARDGDLEALRDLASSGHLSPPISDSQGAGPVHHAARCGRLLCLQFLVSDLGMPADPRTRTGATPLYLACQEGHLHVVECLIKEFGADVHLRARDGMTCLHAAAHMGHQAVVDLIAPLSK
uniref:Uncharacterized protein n=1 Tax=Oryzias latipes TaxID=8090 RepID=A0A3B3HB53_ORYLA